MWSPISFYDNIIRKGYLRHEEDRKAEVKPLPKIAFSTPANPLTPSESLAEDSDDSIKMFREELL